MVNSRAAVLACSTAASGWLFASFSAASFCSLRYIAVGDIVPDDALAPLYKMLRSIDILARLLRQ
ncbi:hypothetical protein [Ferrovibrio sp.]|uniref:hypothetical protein n=1 Tax=Ferrovibrio sp. TaxID=1917215 RepID=UPI0035B2B86A